MAIHKWDDIKRPRKEESMEEQKVNKGKELVGKPLEEAKKLNPKIRVVKQDGQSRIVTMDFIPTRVNVEVENGIVIKVVSFG